jgi:hypothetical protein
MILPTLSKPSVVPLPSPLSLIKSGFYFLHGKSLNKTAGHSHATTAQPAYSYKPTRVYLR